MDTMSRRKKLDPHTIMHDGALWKRSHGVWMGDPAPVRCQELLLAIPRRRKHTPRTIVHEGTLWKRPCAVSPPRMDDPRLSRRQELLHVEDAVFVQVHLIKRFGWHASCPGLCLTYNAI